MIKQLDLDEIYIETQERFVDRVLAWEENFYGNQSNGPQGQNANNTENNSAGGSGYPEGTTALV
jgi:hypothetical protein